MSETDGPRAGGATPEPPPPGSFPGLRRFLDRDGRLKVWPSKLKDQKLVMGWLASHFERGRESTEKQVNELLNRYHAFGDWALLRRALVDHGWLDRASDGSRYRLRERTPQE